MKSFILFLLLTTSAFAIEKQYVLKKGSGKVLRWGYCDFQNDGSFNKDTEEILVGEYGDPEPETSVFNGKEIISDQKLKDEKESVEAKERIVELSIKKDKALQLGYTDVAQKYDAQISEQQTKVDVIDGKGEVMIDDGATAIR